MNGPGAHPPSGSGLQRGRPRPPEATVPGSPLHALPSPQPTIAALPPLLPPGSAADPLRRLGDGIAHVTGLSVFAGPEGWIFTGLLVLAVFMIVGALALGRRRGGRVSG